MSRSQSENTQRIHEQARELFGRRTSKVLTEEDAREIVVNLAGFFGVLRDWDRPKQQSEAGNNAADGAKTPSPKATSPKPVDHSRNEIDSRSQSSSERRTLSGKS